MNIKKLTSINTSLETRESVLTGELRNQVDAIWNAFWSGGISNPLEVLEQITYLLFIRRLDELQTLEENKSNRTGKPIERRIFPEGKDQEGRLWDDLRWSRFKQKSPAVLYGGSVDGRNVESFKKIKEIDGFLIGGASTNEKIFIDIIRKSII